MSWQKLYATFLHCPTLRPPLTKSLLAKADFYYDGTKRSVVCSKCLWSTTQLQTLTEHSLKCPHVTPEITPQYANSNIPKLSSSFLDKTMCQASGLVSGCAGAKENPSIASAPVSFGLVRDGTYEENCVFADGPVFAGNIRHAVEETQYTDPAQRRTTFYNSGWSLNPSVSVDDLVAAGFYYIGPGDRVRCAYCRKKIHQWEPGDDAALEHQRISPSCDFAQNL